MDGRHEEHMIEIKKSIYEIDKKDLQLGRSLRSNLNWKLLNVKNHLKKTD